MTAPPILRLLRQAGASAESDTDRDGVLSYSGETHALAVGIAVGFLAGVSDRWEIAIAVATVSLGTRKAQGKTLREVAREGWYALGGLVLGSILGIGLRGIGVGLG